MSAHTDSLAIAHPLAYAENDWRAYLRGCGLSERHAGLMLASCAGPGGLAQARLPSRLRDQIDRDFAGQAEPLRIHRRGIAGDGVVKWLMATGDGHRIECVYIPHRGRATACLSSQAGCGYGCAFCATAKLGLARNLSVAEIVGQLDLMRAQLTELGLPAVSNIVFMGMGEPLANFDAVVKSIELMSCDKAYAIAPRRITVSTVGIADAIIKLAGASKANLALSLHAPNDDLRTRLMPINRRWPLGRLMAACREYARRRPGRTITIEYIMLSGVNDSPDCAERLCALLAALPVKINLIPFNANPGSEFSSSPQGRIERFARLLAANGYLATIRAARGGGGAAACGQLAARPAQSIIPANSGSRPSFSS